MEFGFYSFSEPLGPGIDFSTSDEALNISSSIVVESNLVATATAQRLAAASISIESNATVNLVFIVGAQISISIDGATLTLGTRIKLAQSAVSISSVVSVNAMKEALAQSAINSNSQVTTSITKEALAQSVISSNADCFVTIVKTGKASAQISSTSNAEATITAIRITNLSLSGNVNLTTAGDIVLATIRISIINNGNITVKMFKFSELAIAGQPLDVGSIRTFLLLDNKPLTNHNRKFDVSVEPVFVENVNWNNRSSRYYKSAARPARRTFSLSWSYVPNTPDKTVDGKRGRDYIKSIAAKPQHHVLKVINLDENGANSYTETSYNVLVKDYSETLIRRDLNEDVYFWDCSISLEEV